MAQQITEHEAAGLKAQFEKYDKDNSGCICASELKEAMVEVFGAKYTEEEITWMIKETSSDENDQVNYEEFVKIMKGP